MAVSIFAKAQKIWVKTTNLMAFKSHFKSVSHIDIFCLFGQNLFINLFYNEGGKHNEVNHEIDYYKMLTIFGLEQRVLSVSFFEKKLLFYRKLIILDHYLKKFFVPTFFLSWNLSIESRFFSYLFSYLNSCTSLIEVITKIDNRLSTNDFHSDIYNSEWYHYIDAMRSACHHIESPQVFIKDGREVFLVFYNLQKLNKRHKKRFTWIEQENRHHIDFDSSSTAKEVVSFVDNWCKRHLLTLDPSSVSDVIRGYESDGRFRTKSMNLSDLLMLADFR